MEDGMHKILKGNIAARELATELKDLIDESVKAVPAGSPFNEERFWETLSDHILSRGGASVVNPLHPDVMSEQEAREFARTLVPWGKYKGEAVGDVDPSYWISMTESLFYRRLLRFVKTKFFQSMQREAS